MSNYGDYYEKTTTDSDLNELPPAENENQDNYIIHGCQPPWMDETNPYLNDSYWSQLQPDNSQSGTFMSLFDHQSHPFDHQSQPWHSQQFSGDGLHSYGPQPSHHSVTHVSNTLGENDTNDSGDSIYFKGNDAEKEEKHDAEEEREVDEFYIRDSTVSYVTDQHFGDRQTLIDWVKRRGREHGCVVVLSRTRGDLSVEFGCDRGGLPRPRGNNIRKAGSTKIGCPFKLLGKWRAGNNMWELTVRNETHNHDPVGFEEGHAHLRRMNDEQKDYIKNLYKQGLLPDRIVAAVQEQYPGIVIINKDVYNLTTKLKAESKMGGTPMQEVEQYLLKNKYVYHCLEDPETSAMKNLFFCHHISYKMWQAFPHLMLVDSTYKTNMFKLPFVQLIGVTSTSKSFCIAHAFIRTETIEDFTWVLERVKILLEGCTHPRVIVTDRDKALIKACEIVFPGAQHNLCRFHIMENIRKKWKSISNDIWEDFAYQWAILCDSPTKEIYDRCCARLEERLTEDNKLDIWMYIFENWLVPYKHKFVTYSMNGCLTYGEHTTNRVEGQHAKLKRFLNGTNNSIISLIQLVDQIVVRQERDIGRTFELSRSKVYPQYKDPAYQLLLRKVSTKCLELIEKQMVLMEKMRDGPLEGSTCGHQVHTFMGIPCACRLAKHVETATPIGRNDVDEHWWKLDFRPQYAEAPEPDYEYEISKLKDKIQESPNPHIRRSWFQKMKDVFTPGQSKTKEPVVRRDTRGRPTTKKPPTKSKANSTKVDPARHSSYTSSEHTVPTPGRHSSYIHGTTPIEPEFPSVLRPGDLVNVRRFRIYLPPWIYPFIKKIIDPKPDGNCGFRAIALALGKRENEWPWVREQMSLEMTKRRMFWSRRMNEELGGAYNSLLRAIEWGEIGPAKEGYWLDFPGHGLVVAQAFNCVVISINIYGSETYFPPVTSPDPLFQYPTITLANVHGCHWLELKLTEGHPIPNPTLYWPRYAGTNAPLWENMYREGRDKYDAIQYELRGSNPTSPVDLDPMGLM